MAPNEDAGVPRAILAGVALIALSTLLFEVVLTRIFAVTLWYYFGTLSISLAMLGTAVAAVACYLRSESLAGENHPAYLSAFSLLLAVFAPLAVFVHLRLRLTDLGLEDPRLLLIFTLQVLLFFLAFFSAGMCIAIALLRYGRQIGTVYFSDLAGASLGCLLVVPLLYRVSGPAVAFLVSTFACAGGFLFSTNAKRSGLPVAFAVLTVAFGLLASRSDALHLYEIVSVKSYGLKSLQEAEHDRVFEQWSPVSRVAVFAPQTIGDNESMVVSNDAGSPTRLFRFAGDFSKLGFLEGDAREIVYHLKKNAHALIIGSGGGIDVLAALRSGQRRITAVEINPVIAELVTGRYADYIGRIFQDPRVTLRVQEGRNFCAGSPDRYDIIQLTQTDSWGGAAAGAYIFNENSLYTIEAVHDYVTHLEPDGILSLTRYYEFDEALRLTNLLVQSLLQSGVSDVGERLILMTEPPSPYLRATLLLKNGRFSTAEAATLREAGQRFGFGLVYAPHLPKTDLVSTDLAELHRRLITGDGAEREGIVRERRSNITPPTDDKPFFFFMTRLRDVFRLDPEAHPARRMAMPILYGMFVLFGLVGVLTLFVPLSLSPKAEIRNAPYRLRLLLYFSLLGVGYMLVEISLIQRLTVFLGHPTYSFVVVLATLLLASGVGSFLSGWWNPSGSPERLLLVLVAVVAIVSLYALVVYDRFIGLMWLGRPERILLCVATLLPPGFLMGMCFPMGMQIARRCHGHLVPWGWGVNGAFSVFAAVSSLVVSLNFGLKAAMATGAMCYALALLVVWSLRRVAWEWADET